MNLLVSRARHPVNLAALEKVLQEFNTGKTAELCHECGVDFLVWRETTPKGANHSISVAIPGAWLDDSRNVPKLEATTRNFARYVATFTV